MINLTFWVILLISWIIISIRRYKRLEFEEEKSCFWDATLYGTQFTLCLMMIIKAIKIIL